MLYDHLVVQDVGFFDANKTGELMNRLASDTTVIQTATTVKKVDNTKGLKAGLCGLGGLAFAGCVLTPNQSFLTTHVALIVSTVALMVYNVQFMLVPEMLLTQNNFCQQLCDYKPLCFKECFSGEQRIQ